ncbi:MAG: glycosyltransferase family 4 protein [Clostridia bacterium]|nr:glycosyltransferase family 4 protein [Clostridia bacterium]
MSKVLFLVNNDVGIYNFRLEVIQRIIKEGYEVIISSPYGKRIDDLIEEGCLYKNIEFSRHGMNPIKECVLIAKYIKLLKEVKPDVVLSYTIKPNIYGGIACSLTKTPYIANITGLGTAIENGGMIQKVLCVLYKIGLRKAHKVFFQNEGNKEFFANHDIYKEKHILIPGSGVNLDRYSPLDYSDDMETTKFLMIARIMKDKGIDEYLQAAETIRGKYPNTEFHICGFCEPEYESRMDDIKNKGTVIYHGMVKDVQKLLKETHCTVLPSYHEGMANVLLESASSARPVIATNIPGCRETFDEGITGIGCEAKSAQSLIDAIEKFLALSHEEKVKMGKEGRVKMEKCFDRQIVVEAYIKEINTILNK